MFKRLEKWGLFSYANSTVVGMKSSLESQPQNKEKRNLSIRENCIHSLAAFNSFHSSRRPWITDEKVFFFLSSVCRVQLRENSSGGRANVHHKSGWLHRQPLAPRGGIQIGLRLLNFFFFPLFLSALSQHPARLKMLENFLSRKWGKNERNKQRGKKLKRAETAHQVSKPLVWLSGLWIYRKNSTRRTQLKHSSETNWKSRLYSTKLKVQYLPLICVCFGSSLTSTFPIATIE